MISPLVFLSTILTLSRVPLDPQSEMDPKMSMAHLYELSDDKTYEVSGCKKYNALRDMIQITTGFRQDLIEKAAWNFPHNFVMSPLAVTLPLYAAVYGNSWQPKLMFKICQMRYQCTMVWAMRPVIDHLAAYNKGLHVANGVFVSPNFPLYKDLELFFRKKFRSPIRRVDFRNPVGRKNFRSEWVMDATRSVDLNANTSLAILSSLSFTGNWSNKFNRMNTKMQTFHNANGDEKELAIMDITGNFGHGSVPEFDGTFFELPYESKSAGQHISLFVIRPGNKSNIVVFMHCIRDMTIQSLISRRKYGNIHIQLPKFKIDSEIDVKALMQAKGVREKSWAGLLSGRHKDQNTAEAIFSIDHFVQKASIEIHEEGTTAVTYDALPVASSLSDPSSFVEELPYYVMIGTTGEDPINLFTACFRI